MSTGSTIEWTGATWNPVVGCTRVSAGCDNCYAVRQSYRLERMGQEKYAGLTVLNPRGERHFNGVVRCDESALTIPLGWRKPRRIFVNSMSDLFHASVPFEFIDRVFAVMALTPRHTYQILTKRPERMAEYCGQLDYEHLWRIAGKFLPPRAFTRGGSVLPIQWVGGSAEESSVWDDDLHPNVWLGTSVENQDAADERIPHLMRCPAAVRFLSCEPLLGAVEINPAWMGTASMRAVKHMREHRVPAMVGTHAGSTKPARDFAMNGDGTEHGPGIDWVIVGGESGPGARPCEVAWNRSIIGQCRAAQVPCFVKQMGALPREHNIAFNSGAWPRDQRALAHGDEHVLVCLRDRKGGDMAEWPEDLRVREWPAERRSAP